MLQSSMRRFLLPLLFGLAASLAAQAQPSVVAHGLIIQLKPGAQAVFGRELPNAAQAKRESLAHERMAAVAQGAGVKGFAHRHLSGDHRFMRFQQPLQGAALQDTLRRLRLHPDVASVEPNMRFKPQTIPNDAKFAQQWHIGSNSTITQIAALNMSSTWAITTGTAVVIAVVDTGVRFSHPDLIGKILPGYDFIEDVENANDGNGRDTDASDPGDWVSGSDINTGVFAGCSLEDSSWHGTFIAGQIAAATNNTVGVSGMNWNARILPVRVSGKCGALLTDIIDGIRWAAGLSVEGVPNNPNPARVINLSFGGDQACSSSYQTVIDELTAVGALLVVSAGNSQGSFDNMQLKRPADCRGVMAVGAVQANGLKTAYSLIGSNMALMTLGGHDTLDFSTSILSVDNTGTQHPVIDDYGYKVGTSFAAPFAAGAASLMLAINPSLTPDALIARLKATARAHVSLAGSPSCRFANQVACNCNTSMCGAGLLDPTAAVQSAYAPAAVIAQVGAPSLGATVVLDVRSSLAVGTSTITSYAWSQVSGASIGIQNANASVAQVILPAAPGEFEFKLRVTDSLGRSGESQLTILTELPSATQSSASAGGGGADRWFWVLLVVLALSVLAARFLSKTGRSPLYRLRNMLLK